MNLELTPPQRRNAIIGLLALAGFAFLLALVPTLLAWGAAGAYILTAVVLLALALVGLLVILLWSETADLDAWTEAEEDALAEEEAEEFLLRCKHCGEVFSVLDDGTRPLRHSCPRCGTTGVIRNVPS